MRLLSCLMSAGLGALLLPHLPIVFAPSLDLPVMLAVAAVLLATMLPLTRVVSREALCALAVLLAAATLLLPAGLARAALVVALGSVFLVHASALELRGVVAGLCLAVALAHPAVGTWRLAAVTLGAAAAVWFLVRGLRAVAVPLGAGGERRGGGLRLRGSLALASLLALSSGFAMARSYAAFAALGAAAAGLALLLRAARPWPQDRAQLLLLAALGTLALAALPGAPTRFAPLLAALAGFALPMLLARALTPAPGRRPGAVLGAGWLLLWAVLPAGAGTGRGVLAALVATGALLLLPRPAPYVEIRNGEPSAPGAPG